MSLDKAAFELAMSERLIDILGGEHGDSREDGKPQQVWFTLVLAFLTDQNPPAPALAGMSALVVDPSGASRRCMAMEFDVLGAQCIAVSSCVAGLQAMQRNSGTANFDVVVLALSESTWQREQMLEFVERLEPRPLIITTGRLDDDSPTNANHLIKPARRRDLIALIQADRAPE
jgi:CheY-like chemotaxis protein